MSTNINEADKTKIARRLLKEFFQENCYKVDEEKPFYCRDSDGNFVRPPYKGDIYIKLEFIIELDPNESHGSEGQTIKDNKRDKRIYQQYGIRTVRLVPKDIISYFKPDKKYYLTNETAAEITNQLKDVDKYQ